MSGRLSAQKRQQSNASVNQLANEQENINSQLAEQSQHASVWIKHAFGVFSNVCWSEVDYHCGLFPFCLNISTVVAMANHSPVFQLIISVWTRSAQSQHGCAGQAGHGGFWHQLNCCSLRVTGQIEGPRSLELTRQWYVQLPPNQSAVNMAVCPKEMMEKRHEEQVDHLLLLCRFCSFNGKAGSPPPVVQLADYDMKESIKLLTCPNDFIHPYSLLLCNLKRRYII